VKHLHTTATTVGLVNQTATNAANFHRQLQWRHKISNKWWTDTKRYCQGKWRYNRLCASTQQYTSSIN